MSQSKIELLTEKGNEALDKAQKEAVRKLEDIINSTDVEVLPQNRLINIEIDNRLLKAIVDKAIEDVEEQIDDMTKSREASAKELAMIIKPRLEMIGYLHQKEDYYKRLLADPDYNTCIFKLNDTINYLMADVRPYVKQLSGMLPGGTMLGVDTSNSWSQLERVKDPSEALSALMTGGKKRKKRGGHYY